MKSRFLILTLLVGIALWRADVNSSSAAEPSPLSKDDFSSIASAVVQLLKSGDAKAFADATSPSLEDWRATRSTNAPVQGEDPFGPNFQKSLERQRHAMQTSAVELLTRAAGLKADFSKVRLSGKAIVPNSFGTVHYSDRQAENETLPWTKSLEVLLTAEPVDAADAELLRGEYKVALNQMIKFPGGWRSSDGIQWISFPPAVADEKVQLEMAIMVKASQNEGITQAEDPALQQLGGLLARIIHDRDVKAFESDAMMSLEAMWKMVQKQAANAGQQPPPREELEKHWKPRNEKFVASARSLMELLERSGIDFKSSEIDVKRASLKTLYARAGQGSADGIEGDPLEVVFTVKSQDKSASGTELSGEYVIAAGEAIRLDGRWLINGEIRWKRLPAGLVARKIAEDMEFENYVAEHRSLPPGTAAPDIEFVRIDNEQKGRLADFRGKVVVLDFWATWCGPCQEPMAKMQKHVTEHRDWKGRVEFLSLSIDDELGTVRNHLQKRGWTNTFNLWAGPGGWEAAPVKTYRVRGVPTCYIIDPEGKITWAGHPAGMQLDQTVKPLLK